MDTKKAVNIREKNEDKVIRRALELYTLLLNGKVVNKKEFAENNCAGVVSDRTVQRYLSAIQTFLSDQRCQKGVEQCVGYDWKAKGHRLISRESKRLSSGEMLAICKILIESRAFSKAGLESLIMRV